MLTSRYRNIAETTEIVLDSTPRTLHEIRDLVREELGHHLNVRTVYKALQRGQETGTVHRTPEGLYTEPDDNLSPNNFPRSGWAVRPGQTLMETRR